MRHGGVERKCVQTVWMTPRAAVLVDPAPDWAEMLVGSLNPGAHAFVITSEVVSIQARRAGFELRDTLLILSVGPSSRYAFLFRKPVAETTVLGQIVETGAGSLNIAKCRIGYGSDTSPDVGRWPPNILFVHGPRCRRSGSRRVKASNPTGQGASKHEPRVRGVYMADDDPNAFQDNGDRIFYGHEGFETINSYECEPRCSVRVLDEQTGERPSTLTGRADPKQIHENPGDNHGTSLFGAGNSTVYADSGGASRFYPQFKNDEQMVDWMQMLLEAPASSHSLPPPAYSRVK
jgi:hypothetical protein